MGEDLCQDLRYGLRALRKNPGCTSVIVLTLALGIGGITAIYSVVNTILLNPLPGPAPALWTEIVERGEHAVSADALTALRGNQDLFTESTWFRHMFLPAQRNDFKDVVRGVMAAPNFFSIWKARPLLGRTFAQNEAVPIDPRKDLAQDSVMVLGYLWWKARFAGDPAVVGRTIKLGDRRFTVIGVMPENFQYPLGGNRVCFWAPAQDPQAALNWGRSPDFGLLVRLKEGRGAKQVQAMLDLTAQRLSQARIAEGAEAGEEWRCRPQGFGFAPQPCVARLMSGYRTADDIPRTFYGLFGAIGFVLLIICLNVATLTLARTERRQQELAVRTALGAGRGRLARQLVTETVLLTGLGGAAGLVAGLGFLRVLSVLIPPNMPQFKPIALDERALGFALLVSAITGLALGLASAWRAGQAGVSDALKRTANSSTSGRAANRCLAGLVVMEVALAFVMLAGAGLMIQSVIRLLRVGPGFNPERLLAAQLWLPEKYSDRESNPKTRGVRNTLLDQIRERLGAVPGVKAVGIWDGVVGEHGVIQLDGGRETLKVSGIGCGVGESDFLRVMGAPLRAGRFLDRGDIGESDGPVVINESMARLCWPGQNALGQTFRLVDSPGGNCYEVVGIVGDVRFRLTQGAYPAFYRPYQQAAFSGAALMLIRTGRDPRSLIAALLKEFKAAEPKMAHPRINVCQQDIEDSTQPQRIFMGYMIAFAGVGLLLAALGIYGVLAYSTTRRAREIGIRLALGGQRSDVLRLVMGEGGRLVSIGAALGLPGAFWLLHLTWHWLFQAARPSVEEGPVSQLLKHHLFQAGATDPLVWAAAMLLLLAVALPACWLPARRATRIDPMEVLKCE